MTGNPFKRLFVHPAGWLLLAAAACLLFAGARAKASVLDDPLLRLDKVEVKSTSGAPAMYINNAKTPAIMFTQWMSPPPSNDFEPYPNYVGNAKYAGIHIYQPRAFGASTLADWTPVLDDILAKDPQAYFFMPIWVQNPNDFGFTALALNEANVDTSAGYSASMGSLKWRQLAGLLVRQTVREFDFSKYRDRILGYMLTAGGTGEWIDINQYENPTPDFDRSLANQIGFREWLKIKYTTDAALRTAWNNPTVTLAAAAIPAKVTSGPFLDPATRQDLIDFMNYDSDMVAKSIEYLASVVKDETNSTRLVGAPYGYTMEGEFHGNVSGSLAFNYLLNSSSIDFFVSPFAYHHRELNDYAGWHGFADSAKLHNKLWLGEDDTPTYADFTAADDWSQHVFTVSDSITMLWKNFMASLTKQFGHWWYDNNGTGQVNTPELVYHLGLMHQLAQAANAKAVTSVTEVALVVDEKSQFYQTPGAFTADNRYSFNGDLGYFRYSMGLMGAPFDVVSLDDVTAGLAGNYKVYVFANAYALTSAQRTAIKSLQSGGRAMVWIKTPGLIDVSTKTASYAALQDLTGLDLRLASSSVNSPQVSYGFGLVDPIGNLTQTASAANLFTSFANNARPHMFAVAGTGDTTLATALDGKITAIKSAKTGWLSYFADDISLLTPSRLRGILSAAGATIYDSGDHFVSANSKFVAVTVPGGAGAETIHFVSNGTVYEVISDKEYTVSGNTLVMPASASSQTYVFYLGTRQDLGMSRPVSFGNPLPHHFASLTRNPKPIVLVPAVSPAPNPNPAVFQLDPDLMTIDNLDVASNYTIAWSSDNPAIATVDSNGLVTGKAVGSTTIRASAAGLSASVTVSVVAGSTFDHIEFCAPLQPCGYSMNKGATYTPTTLQIVRKDGSKVALSAGSAVWSSADANIATVNASSGLITGVNDGATSIKATYLGSEAVLPINVNDTAANVPRDIWFTNGNGYVRFNTVSGTFALNVHAVDKFAVETDVTSSASYSTSNAAVATVSPSGVITPVSTGIAVITATLSQRKARVLVEVGRVNIDPVSFSVATTMSQTATQTPTANAIAPVSGLTNSWSLMSGQAVQVTGGGSSLYAAYGGVSAVQANANFTYPFYDVRTNAVSGKSGQIRPITSITVSGTAPPAPPAPAAIYSEDFNDALAQNWTTVYGTWGLTGNLYRAGLDAFDNAVAYYNGANFTDFTYKGTVKFTDAAHAVDVDLLFRYDPTPGTGGFYQAHIGKGSQMITIYRYTASNNTFTRVGKQVAYNPPINTNIGFTVTAVGDTLTFTVNDGTTVKTTSAVDGTFASGKIGLQSYASYADFDSLEVWAPPAYLENFDDDQAQGWNIYTGGWNVYGTSQYGYELNFPLSPAGTALVGIGTYDGASFDKFTYTGNVRFLGTSHVDADIIFRYQDPGNYYQAHLGYNSHLMTIYKCVNNVFTQVGTSVTYAPPPDTNIAFTVTANGSALSFAINDGSTIKTSTATDATFASGRIGLKSYGSFVNFDDLAVNP